MPFDGKLTDARVNRRILIEALRGEMPDGFTWNFVVFERRGRCGTVGCALGLARAIGLIDRYTFGSRLNAVFGLKSGEVFVSAGGMGRLPYYGGLYARDVTPAMVADALEREPYVE